MRIFDTFGIAAAISLFMALSACMGGSDGARSPSATCPAGGLSGTSYRVTDGDTFKLRTSAGEIVIVRLDQIDAPEKRQPWGNRSKQQLIRLIENKPLCILGDKHDRYGRLLGEVHAGAMTVNTEMVRSGAAWAYRQYLRDQSLIGIETEARDRKIGLWSMPDSDIMPPWDFRRAVRNHESVPLRATPLPSAISGPGAALDCSMKPTCRAMASCDEAMQWLSQCGPEGIDGDRDGMPCERLCRGHAL
jgi:endonuclease YncB( thermonuclease family)